MSSSKVADEHTRPTLIVLCQNEHDVAEAVSFASRCGYSVAVRSGGHQYAALSSCVKKAKCLQLDVSALDTFVHKTGSTQVTLGVGLKLEEVHGHLVPLGLTLPVGVCTSVGVGGHFQSSSQGFLGRSFGLGMDHIVSFRIVTADGKIRTVDQTSDAELYWAVLGGCPGSWGVVLDYTFNALSASQAPNTEVFLYTWPYNHDLFVQLASAYMRTNEAPELARDLMMLMVVSPLPGIDNGALSPELFAKYIQPMLYHVHSMSANQFFDDTFLDEVAFELDARMKLPGMYSSFQFQPYGGTGNGSQVNRNIGKNAYPVRDIGMHVDDWLFFRDDDQADIAQERIEHFRESSEVHWAADGSAESSWMTTDTFTDHDDVERFKNYFPSDEWFKRLQTVKTQVDPHNLFSTPMTIPPLKTCAKCKRDILHCGPCKRELSKKCKETVPPLLVPRCFHRELLDKMKEDCKYECSQTLQ